jgi:hypothetical protein
VKARLPDGLLVDVQRRLEAFYCLDRQEPVTRFLIPEDEAAGLPGGGSRTLIRQGSESLSLGIVLENSIGEQLAGADPRVHLHTGNLGPFCALTEEISHFVYVLFCAHVSRSVTQLELELQGEVDKYLNTVFLLSLQNDGAVSPRLRELLFRSYRLNGGMSAEHAARYKTASDLAYRYCGYLEAQFLRPSRLADLAREGRRFYRLGQRDKLERIARISGSP